MVCTGFPGPGVQDAILANPMQEFIEPEGSEVIHGIFEHFLTKHPKEYNDNAEHEHRQNLFRQNLR